MALFWPGSALIRDFLLTFYLEKIILILKYFKMTRQKKEKIPSKEQKSNMAVIEQDYIPEVPSCKEKDCADKGKEVKPDPEFSGKFDRLENKYSLRELLDIEAALRIVLEEDRKKMILGELPEATEFNQLSKNYYRILGAIKNKLIKMLK